MTSDYDFTVFDITQHNFEFGNMTEEEIAEKKKEAELNAIAKEAMKSPVKTDSEEPKKVFKPKFTIKGFKPSDKKD
jgi:NADH-quinone oxidoreductase subunit I